MIHAICYCLLLRTHDRLVLETWQVQRTLDGSRDKQSVLSSWRSNPLLESASAMCNKIIKRGRLRSSLAFRGRCDVHQKELIVGRWQLAFIPYLERFSLRRATKELLMDFGWLIGCEHLG
jgi:hypothetical protein